MTHYRASWQEQAEKQERTRPDVWHVPPWSWIMEEALFVRRAFMSDDARRAKFATLYDAHAHERGTIVAPLAETFTPTNMQHFQVLPCVEAIKQTAVAEAFKVANTMISPALVLSMQNMLGHNADLLTDSAKQNIAETVRAEQAHMLYHKSMWRAHGRRVVVVDPTTYTLLTHTDLPAFPASLLAFPWPSFYIQLPPKSFEFEVRDVRAHTVDRRYAEGVCVAIDYPQPEHDGPRELSFMVMGEDEGMGADGRNCAFASIRFGPDATLDQFEIHHNQLPGPSITAGGATSISPGYGEGSYAGAHELSVHIPRVIVGLMLYLASEHPDVIPVPPVERKTFADVRSPAQRETARARQAARLRDSTRLPVLLIGSRLDDAAQRVRVQLDADAARTGKRWTLDREVWVRGHWRWQAFGPGRTERKHMWIRPFRRGPDAAESMAIRAARVPRAQLSGERSK